MWTGFWCWWVLETGEKKQILVFPALGGSWKAYYSGWGPTKTEWERGHGSELLLRREAQVNFNSQQRRVLGGKPEDLKKIHWETRFPQKQNQIKKEIFAFLRTNNHR